MRVSIWLSDAGLHPEHQKLSAQNFHLPLGLSQLVLDMGTGLRMGSVRGRRGKMGRRHLPADLPAAGRGGLCHSIDVDGRRRARLNFAPLPGGSLDLT